MPKRNRSYDREAVLAEWKSGEYTQSEIARKHKISVSTVNVAVKGVPQRLGELIKTQVSIKQELNNFSEKEVEIFEKLVKTKTQYIQFFNDVTFQNISTLAAKLDATTSIADHKNAQEAILKGRETVLGKEPLAAVTINNTQQTAVKISDNDLLDIATGSCQRIA